MADTKVSALILAGGRSTRLGQDKVWLPLEGPVPLVIYRETFGHLLASMYQKCRQEATTMNLHHLMPRAQNRKFGPMRRWTLLRATGLLLAFVAVVLAAASCGSAAPTQSPVTSTAVIPGRTQTSVATATSSPQAPATVAVATRAATPSAATAVPSPTIVTPSLLTSMLVEPRTVAANSVVTYVIVIMNDMLGGADPGASVVVTGSLPAHTTYVGNTASAGASLDASGRLVWTGMVTRGLSVAISFQVRVNQDSPAGTQLESVAQVTDALGRTATARAAASVVAPVAGQTPPPIAVQPAGARTNIKDVDLIIDAVLANDLEARRKLIAYIMTPCTTAQGAGGPPKCAPGETNGTRVEVFPFLGEEGEHIRRPAIDRILQFSVTGLYGVYRVPDSAFRAEYWPAGKYALVFVATGLQRQATVFVEDGKIVRLELSRQERWLRGDAPGIDWLLAPVGASGA